MSTNDIVHPEYLVEVDELAAMLGRPGVRVLDVTARLTAALENTARTRCFDEGHIPGSVCFDVGSGHGVLSDPDHDLPWMWPSPDRVTGSLRAAGVDQGDRIVIVASTPRPGVDAGTMWCTRAWWTLHHMGLDVAVLRGGIEGWVAAGHPLTTEATVVEPGNVTVTSDGLHARATSGDVLAALDDGATCVVDALSPANYAGEEPGYGPRRGHITGAVNIPGQSLIRSETADFIDASALTTALSALRPDERPIISYCGGAIAATMVAFGLALLGHNEVRVYDGSLMEWSRDPDLPMT
jgi:thiosulfate/3-mercaptopyruvate sulfurtransferase